MRFTCGHCGRAYVADDRIEGLAFKMPCRRCGQIISVAGGASPATEQQAGAEATAPRPAASVATPPSAPPMAPPGTVGTLPPAGKGRSALLAVIGAVALAAAGGVAWYLKTPASRSAPPQAERPREADVAATQAASVPPEVPPAPGSASAPAASPPAAEPAALPAEARRKAERKDARKRAPPSAAAAAPATSPPASAPPGRPGPGPAAIPAAPPRSDLPPRDEQQIQATLARYEGSFDGCVAEARRDEPELLATPRAVVVTMTVRPGGEALYPTLDDAQLSGTALGACVKKQSARMVFPESGGEPVRVTMPLVLGR